MYTRQGNYTKAEPLYLQALAIRETVLGSVHPDTSISYAHLADLYKNTEEWPKSRKYFNSAVNAIESRAIRGFGDNILAQATADGEIKGKVELFYIHAIFSGELSIQRPAQSSDLLSEAYSSSQYALRTSAGAALGQAAARFAASDDALSETVRQRQDLTGEWSAVNESLTSSISAAADTRNKALEQTYRDRLVAIDEEIAVIDTRLEADFPEYFALTSPKPLGVEETQGLLYDNEALVMFLAGDEGTLVFAVTKDKVDWTLVCLLYTSPSPRDRG